MNVLKNFEAVFVVAVAVAACTSYFAEPADATANAAVKTNSGAATMSAMSIATPSRMAVVSVVGKRMSAIEKQRSLEDERRLAKLGAANPDRS
jgi:hypothetical protein